MSEESDLHQVRPSIGLRPALLFEFNPLEDTWQNALASIRSQVTQANFSTYFQPLRYLGFSNDTLELEVDDPFFRDWIQEHYHDLLVEAVSSAANSRLGVEIKVAQDPQPANFHRAETTNAESSSEKAASQVETNGAPQLEKLRTFPVNKEYTFDTFVVGDSNEFSYAATRSVADQPGKAYNPLFVYGDTGLGKTHLLHAIANHLLKTNASIRITYVTGEDFMNQVIKSITLRQMEGFRDRYRRECDVLLVDDVHILAGKERTQEEFFYTFNALHTLQKQIVLTSDRTPQEIHRLEERLRSRFNWGLTTDIKPPQFETRVAILRGKATQHGIQLPDDVAFFLAENIRSNVRELEGALTRLGAYSSLTGRFINMDLARESLKSILENRAKALTIDSIQKIVAEHYDVRIADLKGQSRKKKFALPRRVAMYLCRKHTQTSFPQIGEGFAKDHSTVITACKRMEQSVAQDLAMRSEVEALERKLPI